MMQKTLLTYKNLASKYSLNFIANAGQQGFRFLLLYFSAKVLGPKEFAIISLLILLSTYLLNSNLGAINGIKKQIPLVYLKEGNEFTLNAFFSIFNFNVVCTTVFSILVAFILHSNYNYSILTSSILVLLSVSSSVFFSIQAYFTSAGKWKQLSLLQVVCATFLLVSIISLYYSSYLILLIGYTLSFLLSSIVFFAGNSYKPIFNKVIIKENIAIGFPVMISGFIFLLFQTTDRLIVSHYYSQLEFGYYSFAWVLVMSLNLLSNMSSEIILQRAASRFSIYPDRSDLFRFISKFSIIVLALLSLISFFIVVIIEYAIPIYFQEYEKAIPITKNLLIAYIIQQLALGPANYYYIIGRQWAYNIMLTIASIVNIGILWSSITFHDHLPALGTLSKLYIASSLLYVIFLYLPLIKKKFR